jgi:hypothetical protein
MIEISHKDVVKYLLGILILLAFLAILGIYLFFLGRFPLGGNNYGAGVLLAGQQNNDDEVNQRISAVQREIDETLARVRELENANKPAVKPVTNTNTTTAAPAEPKILKITRFTASQALVTSGTQVNFSYASENLSRGVSYRLLLQCPTGVSAIYSNGVNVCRRSITEALPIDNSGNYSATLSNGTSEPATIIAVLLASDITDGLINFRDSKVITVTVMPTGNYVSYNNSDYTLLLTATPSGAPAPATISFTATLDDLNTCVQSHWEFGDGITSESSAVCLNSVSSIRSRTLFQNHQYNQPGTYTATFYAGSKKVSRTIYISAATTYYSNPTYTPYYTYTQPTYNYVPPVYNYTYNPQPQPPVYTYNYPSLPDVPTVPTNFRAVSSSNNSVTLNWSAPTYGNVVNYTIYRRGGSSLATPISSSSSTCGNTSGSTCHYTVSGNLTSFTDNNVASGDTYTYRIVANNGYGTSNFSDSLTVTLAESNSPTVPRTFTATVNGGRIILNWSAPTGGNVSSYTIYRRGGNSLPVPVTISPRSCNTSDLDLCYFFVGGSTFSLTDANLLPNTTYTYRIIATNPFGTSEYSDSLTIVSGQAEPAVSTPTLNPANRVDGLGLTQLSWNSVGASYYKVLRSTNRNDAIPSNEDLISGCTTGTTNSCFLSLSGDERIFSTQVNDTRYDTSRIFYYRVRAYSSNGASNWSNEVTANPNTITITPPPIVLQTITFSSNPVVPIVASNGTTMAMCQTSNSISTSRLRAFTTDTLGRDKRFCSFTSMDTQSGVFRYKFGCYGPNDRSTVDGSLLMGTARNFVCEEVDASGIPLVPSNSRSIVRNCNSGDAGTDAICNGTTLTPPPPVADPVITSYTVDGQTSPNVSSGSLLNLSYSGTNVSSYKLFVQCPANVAATDQSNSSNLCRTNQNDAVSITGGGSYQFAIFNTGSTNQTVNATLLAFRANGTLSHSITRLIVVNPAVVTPTPTPDPIITSFNINNQISPLVPSGQMLNLSYTGSNIVSYKLFVSCPANVAATDQSNSSNLCRTSQSDAFTVSTSGSYQMAIYNMNGTSQNVIVALLAFRSNGSLSHSITRTISVSPQPGF